MGLLRRCGWLVVGGMLVVSLCADNWGDAGVYSQCDSDHAGDLLVSSDREGTTLRVSDCRLVVGAAGHCRWVLLPSRQESALALALPGCGELRDVGCCLWPVPRPACCILWSIVWGVMGVMFSYVATKGGFRVHTCSARKGGFSLLYGNRGLR